MFTLPKKLLLPPARLFQLILLLPAPLLVMVTGSCSLEKGPTASIRGHTMAYDRVAHGEPASKGERYCQTCHGTGLLGGTAGEPSCFRCHGQNWQLTGSETSLAPASHTEVQGGKFRHHPSLQAPAGTCDTAGCHGEDLNGDRTEGTPGCLLCHEALWQN